ncbi:helix-turn-helix transcriptional regulator [Ferrimonas balearica]|uniref:helix-turn-helix transcriptional regulator n=1 Tax=Ferrimonas balearica TaxID=44012 RepID=UPI001C994024|nr:helix-turn-helix transcriptional regulator [Ferrimonas balearica]MBY5920285.1 helix-turn-helix transcriptional regulator [Ferrimonas balearica]MBY5997030.1 helix-turn-helix transcriptional regulator [Ferrimonas balearica]
MNRFEDIPTVGYRTSFNPSAGIEVLDLEHFRQHQGSNACDLFEPHRVAYFCMIYIERGSGCHQVDGVEHPYRDGSVIFINKNQIHAFDPDDRPLGKMVSITPAFFSECSANIRNSYFVPFHMSLTHSPVLPMDDTINQTCKAMLNEIATAQKERGDDDVFTQLLFSALVLKLARERRHIGSAANDEDRARFNDFLERVENQFAQYREAKTYAEQMYLSYKSLNLLCKRCCGRTAKQIIDFRLNLEITRKLSMKGGSIQSIAFELGFDDTTNFVKYFKRHNQVTPTAFRSRFENGGQQGSPAPKTDAED